MNQILKKWMFTGMKVKKIITEVILSGNKGIMEL
jgi:hypothetical protein